jgi:DNA polymerase III subunit beta
MKVVADRSALLDAINLVSGVVAGRTPRQQLTCVKLTAANEGDAGILHLTGTDGEIALRVSTSRVEVQKAGEALIPADKLRQIISAEDQEPTLTLTQVDEGLEITGSDARFRIMGYAPQDFPQMPELESSKTPAAFTSGVKQNAGAISDLIARTLFATARENSRYAINGVLLQRKDGRLEMVATDGRRLALARVSIAKSDATGPDIKCIVPTKALQLLQKLLGSDAEEAVDLAVADNRILFRVGGDLTRATLSSVLVEGSFPPYEDVIPKDQDITVTMDRDLVYSAVRRAALLTNEESRGVRLSFDGKERRLKLSSRAPEMGEANVEIDVTDYKGADIEIGFNPGFITEALKVIPQTEVLLELKASGKPGLLKAGNDFLYVVMPVSLS